MADRGARLLGAMAKGPLVLDAAMGTRLIARGLRVDARDDDSALWNLTRPEAVAEVHALDVAAGADVLLTNTFLATRTWLEPRGSGDRVMAVNRRAVSLARGAAGPDRFVVGSIGPTAAADLSGAAYREQAEALVEAGVDALLLETHLHGEAVFGLGALSAFRSFPRIVSLRRFPNPDVTHLVRQFEDLGVSALGVNCVGVDSALAWAERLGRCTGLPLFVRPSTGVPGSPGGEDSPAKFADSVAPLVAAGARLIGGCCGTTEAHVAALRTACYDPSIRSQAGRPPHTVRHESPLGGDRS